MENLKTLGTLLQEVVEKEEKRYSLYEFLVDSTSEERKEIQKKLVDSDYKQFYEYMDGYTFVNETEIRMAANEYLEFVNNRPLDMWEMMDMWETVDDYITTRNIQLDDDENVIN